MLAPCPHTFLAAGDTRRGWRFQSGKSVFKRNHPRIDEHQSRIAKRHQWRRCDFLVVGVGEKIQEGPADVVG